MVARAGVYECSGILIASDVELSAPLAAEADPSSVDVTVVLGETRPQPFERPSADVVAELVVDGYPFYTFCRVEGAFVGRLPGIADFVVDLDLKRVVCHPAEGGRSHVIPIVVPGTVTAFLLAMGGRCVLHGSAVDLGGQALAFVGASGQGKSTMAALFCAAGAPLVTDDVLALEFEPTADGGEIVRCFRSGAEIRLREKAASLTARFSDAASVRITADERHAVAPLSSDSSRLPLGAIVLPRPDRDRTRVEARLLGPGEASLWLGRYQRIEGWQGRDHLRQQFEDLSRVAAGVPVVEAFVPWGPPFAHDLADQVLAGCDLEKIFTTD